MNKHTLKLAALALTCIAAQAHAYTTWTCLDEKLNWTATSHDGSPMYARWTISARSVNTDG